MHSLEIEVSTSTVMQTLCTYKTNLYELYFEDTEVLCKKSNKMILILSSPLQYNAMQIAIKLNCGKLQITFIQFANYIAKIED